MSDGYIPFAERVSGDAGATGVAASAPDFLSLGGTGNADSDGGNGGSDSGDDFDPAIHIGRDKRNADGSYRRKRGRRAGNSAPNQRRTKADSSASVESLTRILTVLHVGIAAATKTPEMVLEDVEAKALANATAEVLAQFDIRPDPRIEAVIGLCVVAGGIYGPRAYLIRERRKEEANARKSSTVHGAHGQVLEQ